MQQLLDTGTLPLLADLALEFGPLLNQPATPSIKLSSGRGKVRRLRRIRLPYCACIPANLAALPDSLTALALTGDGRIDPLQGPQLQFSRYRLSFQTLQELPCVNTLRELRIFTYWVVPAILPPFPQLRHLALKDSAAPI